MDLKGWCDRGRHSPDSHPVSTAAGAVRCPGRAGHVPGQVFTGGSGSLSESATMLGRGITNFCCGVQDFSPY